MTLAEFFEKHPDLLDEVCATYGLQLRVVSSGTVRLESSGCVVKLSADRGDHSVLVTLRDPKQLDGKEYRLDYLPILRARKAYGTPQKLAESAPQEQNLKLCLEERRDWLRKYADDLLRGDFTRLDRRAYEEFDDYLGAHIWEVFRFAWEHPIRERFNVGDFRWVDDLRAWHAAHPGQSLE